ncbi:hypothetical protein Hanom_Chr03g00192061 [Helianthus anomalus]
MGQIGEFVTIKEHGATIELNHQYYIPLQIAKLGPGAEPEGGQEGPLTLRSPELL